MTTANLRKNKLSDEEIKRQFNQLNEEEKKIKIK